MAHIFKHPNSGNKGIVIFSNKEWRAFAGSRIYRGLTRLQLINSKNEDEPKGFAVKFLQDISKKYFIGVHFGGFQFRYQQDKASFGTNFVDFVLSVESTLPNLKPNIFRIPLNCRNFIPEGFKNLNYQKIWDYIAVGRNVNFKMYPELFASIKKLLQIEPDSTFLLIVPTQTKMNAGVYNTISKDFYDTFSFKEQEQIAFFYLHPELDVGINQNQLIRLYNLSRVFMLFSTQIETRFFTYGEGDSRVISEALCCGLPVVCSSSLEGGGRDYLTAENSVIFNHYDDAHLALIEAKNKFASGIGDNPQSLTREDYSMDLLLDYFQKFYQQQGQTFDGQLINTDHLDIRIPSHYANLPWKIDPMKPTADILNKQQFEAFASELML